MPEPGTLEEWEAQKEATEKAKAQRTITVETPTSTYKPGVHTGLKSSKSKSKAKPQAVITRLSDVVPQDVS